MANFPVEGHCLCLLLFTEVQNSRELLDSMQAGVLTPELAFLNAHLVSDTFPVLAAAHKALLSHSQGRLTTRSLHAELIYNYAASKHISESLRRCGIGENTTYVLVARFDATAEEMESTRKLVRGIEVDLSELSKRADRALIHKHFKITPMELQVSSLSDAIACRIAAREAM